MTTPTSAVPEGFARFDHGAPFLSAIGPIYIRPTDDCPVLGLLVDRVHLNMANVVHGGMLATLADSAMGMSLADTRKRRGIDGWQVTVSLTVDYLEACRAGEWIEAHSRIRKMGRKLVFMDCVLRTAERDVLTASGVFALTSNRG